jgi:hypothetical protein
MNLEEECLKLAKDIKDNMTTAFALQENCYALAKRYGITSGEVLKIIFANSINLYEG